MEKLRTLVICRALLLSATSDELRARIRGKQKNKNRGGQRNERQAVRGLSVHLAHPYFCDRRVPYVSIDEVLFLTPQLSVLSVLVLFLFLPLFPSLPSSLLPFPPPLALSRLHPIEFSSRPILTALTSYAVAYFHSQYFMDLLLYDLI